MVHSKGRDCSGILRVIMVTTLFNDDIENLFHASFCQGELPHCSIILFCKFKLSFFAPEQSLQVTFRHADVPLFGFMVVSRKILALYISYT